MKVKITKGVAWYEELVGHTFYVDSEDVNSDVGHIYYIDPEWMAEEVEGRRFVSAEDCVVVDEFGEVGEWEGEALREVDNNSDSVKQPQHYTQGSIEVIDIIAQTVSGYDDPFLGYTLGNVIKYISRAPYKHDDPLEDLKKSREYITFAIEKLEGDSDKQKRY